MIASTTPPVPGLPDDGPVFSEPWEAQAFAMVVHLNGQGAFSWEEWASFLSEEIHGGAERSYYEHWLAALELVVAAKGLTDIATLEYRAEEWLAAAARTPHGDPIEL